MRYYGSQPDGEVRVEYEIARRTPRYSFVVDVEVTDVHSEILIKAKTKELSMFGCGVDTVKLFPKGSTVRINLSYRGAEVKALARVVYASAELGMGLVFGTVEADDEVTLQGWIAEFMGVPAGQQ